MPGIIVGIDGSVHSRRALEWAVKEAAVHRTPLTVLTVHPTMHSYSGVPVSYPGDQDFEKRAREAAQEETDEILAQAGDGAQPPSVTVRAVSGLPTEELLNAAADADLIVLGSRGTGGFRRLRVGSVSTQVTQHAPCPVVVMPAVDE
jgi:nucleotide-binding universal stress UspA family protein